MNWMVDQFQDIGRTCDVQFNKLNIIYERFLTINYIQFVGFKISEMLQSIEYQENYIKELEKSKEQ